MECVTVHNPTSVKNRFENLNTSFLGTFHKLIFKDEFYSRVRIAVVVVVVAESHLNL